MDLSLVVYCALVGPTAKACQPQQMGMDAKTFLATMTGHLAWPVATLLIAAALMWLLRKHVSKLVERLEELALPGGVKITLRKELDKGREQSETVIIDNIPGIQAQGSNPPEQIVSLAQTFPEAAILESYKRIESELVSIRNRLGIEKRSNLPTVMNELIKRELLDYGAVEFFNTLRRARNSAAHAGAEKVTPSQAMDYAQQVEAMLAVLKPVSEQLQVGAPVFG